MVATIFVLCSRSDVIGSFGRFQFAFTFAARSLVLEFGILQFRIRRPWHSDPKSTNGASAMDSSFLMD